LFVFVPAYMREWNRLRNVCSDNIFIEWAPYKIISIKVVLPSIVFDGMIACFILPIYHAPFLESNTRGFWILLNSFKNQVYGIDLYSIIVIDLPRISSLCFSV